MGLSNESMLKLIKRAVVDCEVGLVSDVECLRYVKKFFVKTVKK